MFVRRGVITGEFQGSPRDEYLTQVRGRCE